jgi:hypothetical protein
MPETVMDNIVSELKRTGSNYYPQRGELRNVRVVGHTPKNDHYIYDIVIDFADGSERLAAKVYRASKCGQQGARAMAQKESENLNRIYDVFEQLSLSGVPRPIGNFSDLGAVVVEKFNGLPLQSIIMKAALLPGYADHGNLSNAARQTGLWLRNFHRSTAAEPLPFEVKTLIAEMEKLCENCKGSGLDDQSIRVIMAGAKGILTRSRKTLPSSAVLNDFNPLNVVVGDGVGVCDYATMTPRGVSYQDVAQFLACVEALEKYPFCNRNITSEVQDEFIEAYGMDPEDLDVVRVLKMKTLLGMFAQGRNVKESAVRKKVMWATVMKRFIHQAAQRSLAPAA